MQHLVTNAALMIFQTYLDREIDEKIENLNINEYQERVVVILETFNYNFIMRDFKLRRSI